MSDGMGRELAYLSSHATNRYFIPNWGKDFITQEGDAYVVYDKFFDLWLKKYMK